MARRLALAFLVWAAFHADAYAAQNDIKAQIEAELAILKDKRQGLRRRVALSRLGMMGRDAYPAVPALIRIIKDPGETKEHMDMRAITTLANLGSAAVDALPVLIAKLDEPGYSRSRPTTRALGAIGGPAVRPLLARLGDRRRWVRRNTLQAFAEMRPVPKAALMAAIRALGDKEREVKLAAFSVLMEMGPRAKAAVPAICAQLKSGNPEVRVQTVRALGRIGPPARGAGGLVQRRLADSSEYVRRHAAVALFRMSPSRSTAGVVRNALRTSKESHMRGEIIKELARSGSDAEPATPFLIEHLRDKETPARRAAADALGEIGTRRPEIVPALKKALRHEDREFVYRVKIALARCGEDAEGTATWLARRLGPASGNVRSDASENLVKIGRPAVPALVSCLGSEKLFVRGLAVRALGEIGPEAKEALPALKLAYENRNRNAKYSWKDYIPKAIEMVEAKAAPSVRRRGQ